MPEKLWNGNHEKWRNWNNEKLSLQTFLQKIAANIGNLIPDVARSLKDLSFKII